MKAAKLHESDEGKVLNMQHRRAQGKKLVSVITSCRINKQASLVGAKRGNI